MSGDVRVKDDFLQRVLEGREYLLFDGAMGTMLQRNGLVAGERPDLLCLSAPDAITAIHREYVQAGSQAVTTNTFGANRIMLAGDAAVQDVYAAAVACAKAAGARYVAGDIGPTGELLDPLGDLEFEEAVDVFSEQVRAADAAGADLIIIETMADPQEMEAALTAAKRDCNLPVFATMTFAQGGRTMFGTTAAEAARAIEQLGADALGMNCSVGPEAMVPLVAEMRAVTELPLIVQANAGLPEMVNGETTYTVDIDVYLAAVEAILDAGATIVGGCCGTDPDYIGAMAGLLSGKSPA